MKYGEDDYDEDAADADAHERFIEDRVAIHNVLQDHRPPSDDEPDDEGNETGDDIGVLTAWVVVAEYKTGNSRSLTVVTGDINDDRVAPWLRGGMLHAALYNPELDPA